MAKSMFSQKRNAKEKIYERGMTQTHWAHRCVAQLGITAIVRRLERLATSSEEVIKLIPPCFCPECSNTGQNNATRDHEANETIADCWRGVCVSSKKKPDIRELDGLQEV